MKLESESYGVLVKELWSLSPRVMDFESHSWSFSQRFMEFESESYEVQVQEL